MPRRHSQKVQNCRRTWMTYLWGGGRDKGGKEDHPLVSLTLPSPPLFSTVKLIRIVSSTSQLTCKTLGRQGKRGGRDRDTKAVRQAVTRREYKGIKDKKKGGVEKEEGSLSEYPKRTQCILRFYAVIAITITTFILLPPSFLG